MDDRYASCKIVPENRTFVCGKQYIGTANNIFVFAVIAYNFADQHIPDAINVQFQHFSAEKRDKLHFFKRYIASILYLIGCIFGSIPLNYTLTNAERYCSKRTETFCRGKIAERNRAERRRKRIRPNCAASDPLRIRSASVRAATSGA